MASSFEFAEATAWFPALQQRADLHITRGREGLVGSQPMIHTCPRRQMSTASSSGEVNGVHSFIRSLCRSWLLQELFGKAAPCGAAHLMLLRDADEVSKSATVTVPDTDLRYKLIDLTHEHVKELLKGVDLLLTVCLRHRHPPQATTACRGNYPPPAAVQAVPAGLPA